MKLITRQIGIFFLLVVILFSVGACKKDGSITGNHGKPPENSVEYAPANIWEKSLVLYNSKMQTEAKASEFTSSGTCTVIMLPNFTLLKTPTYSYNKTDNNVADFNLNETERLKIGTLYSDLKLTYPAHLTFTSETGGNYTGSENCVTTGNVSGSNGTTTRSISGTFTLY